MEKHNILELLLFYTIPRGDTNPIAHELIRRFGSFSGVFDASYEELVEVKGIGAHTASLIKLIPEISRAYLDDRKEKGIILRSVDDCEQFLMNKFVGKNWEEAYLVCLDGKHKVLGCPLICRGDVSSVHFSVRSVVEAALRLHATAVVLAHNHPTGLALPSDADKAATEKLRKALEPLNIRLLDHQIFSPDQGDYVSMAQSNMISREEF